MSLDPRIAALDAHHAAWRQYKQSCVARSCDFTDNYGNRWQIDYVMRGRSVPATDSSPAESPYAVLLGARLGSSTVAIHDLSVSMRRVFEDAAFEAWESRV